MNKFRTTLGYLSGAMVEGLVVHTPSGAASAPPGVQLSIVGARLPPPHCAVDSPQRRLEVQQLAVGSLPSREPKKPDLADHFLDPSDLFC